jgi:hypothetical protein
MKEGHFHPSAKCSFAVICGRLSFLTIRGDSVRRFVYSNGVSFPEPAPGHAGIRENGNGVRLTVLLLTAQ